MALFKFFQVYHRMVHLYVFKCLLSHALAVANSHGGIPDFQYYQSPVAAAHFGEHIIAVTTVILLKLESLILTQVILATFGTLTFATVEWKHYKKPVRK